MKRLILLIGVVMLLLFSSVATAQGRYSEAESTSVNISYSDEEMLYNS